MISIVIPNYNGQQLLERNFRKLLAALKKSKLEFEIIVVDDASNDDSVSVIENLPDYHNTGLRLIKREVNGGFPISADQGIRDSKGEFVFVIKNDALPESEKYFQFMIDHFDKKRDSGPGQNDGKKVFAVSSALETIEDGKKEIRGYGEIYFERGLFKHRRGRNQTRISAWADGGSCVFRRDLYLKVGGFDKVYRPGYWEDVDLGYRAWKAGYAVEFEPKAVLIHDFESGVYKKKYGEERIKLINLRNQFIFTLKNGDLPSVSRFFFWETYNHLASIKSGETTFIQAYWMAMWRMPEIIKSRIFQKTINKLSDSEVFQKFQ